MNLDQIATKCFILALFIRDDGQRLLLGDGYYDFNQKLQHFQSNTIANDVVEIQGDSGQLLAGQVMRSGAQKFEGYIGDATTNRQTIEQKRSDFMAFFRIKHFYKVIYIFPDGTAIQRQRGYLTDAPTIPEIFQKFPEYSVALNFEDANYYEYAEDEHGDEIYAHIAGLALAGGATGGLIWDEIGAVTNGISWSGIQTAQGEYIQITNELSLEAPLASVEMLGKAEQVDTPTPTSPQPISVVTGENVVKIEGKNLLGESHDNYGLNGIDGTIMQIANRFALVARVQEGQTYTTSRSAVGTSTYFWVAFFAEKPVVGSRSITFADMQPTTLQRTLTAPSGAKYCAIFYGAGTSPDCQLELGSTATDYEPYQAQEFEVNLGKNLFEVSSPTRSVTRAGMTITIADDGLITLNGTATADIYPDFVWGINNNTIDHATCYTYYSGSPQLTASAEIVGGSFENTTQGMRFVFGDNSATTITIPLGSSPHSATISSADGLNRVWMYIPNGAVYNNFKFYLQLERGGTATSFAPYFPPIELAKIGNYQDRIYKEDSKWYIEKQTGKAVLDGSEAWIVRSGATAYAYAVPDMFDGNNANGLSDHFRFIQGGASSGQSIECIASASVAKTLNIFTNEGSMDTVANLKTWLASNPTTVYYALATPTTTEITNEALIAQLDALGASSLYVGVNNIGTETQNAMPTLKIEYYTEVDLDGAGYEWEPGGNTARTIVTVAGVDSAWPIWTIQGGAQNPTLTNITTGQTITWQGFVPAGQTLTINMAEMTADLAGANVFEHITGEWIRLAPGNNTLVYTAGSADKPSTLSWNGVLA